MGLEQEQRGGKKNRKKRNRKGWEGKRTREAADIAHYFDFHRFHTHDLNSHSNSKEGVTTNNRYPWFMNIGGESQRNENEQQVPGAPLQTCTFCGTKRTNKLPVGSAMVDS